MNVEKLSYEQIGREVGVLHLKHMSTIMVSLYVQLGCEFNHLSTFNAMLNTISRMYVAPIFLFESLITLYQEPK